MSVTAAQVNELRKKTGAGMMDCKKALTESNGDFDKAIEAARAHGGEVLVGGNRIDGPGSFVEPTIIKGGLIFLNSSLIPETPSRTDVEFLQVPIVELANEVGNARGGNMVMIGAVCAKTAGMDSIRTMKPHINPVQVFIYTVKQL